MPEDVHHLAILSNSSREVRFILGRHSNNPALSETTFVAQPALSGEHNVANALVASALAWHTGIAGPEIAQTVQNFGGVKRRMEVHIDHPNGVYLDDYAHHPTELRVLLEAIRSRWPNREITLIFQPHLYGILPQNLRRFWLKQIDFFCFRFILRVKHPFQVLMHNGCLITSRAPTNI